MTKESAIYAFVAALISPFLIWALVAAMARRNSRFLERIYPAVKVLSWVLYAGMVIGYSLIIFAFGDSIDRKTAVYICAIVFPLYGGINLMRAWIRRRVEPEAEPKTSEGGWWPTPKDY